MSSYLVITIALLLGGLGGGVVSLVAQVWFRRVNPDQADIDDVAAVVEAQGKALRRLTMQKVRAYAADSAVPPIDPQSPAYKAELRRRAFGSKH